MLHGIKCGEYGADRHAAGLDMPTILLETMR